MELKKLQKYVVTGSRQFYFATSGFTIGKRKKREIHKDEDGKCQVKIGHQTYTGELIHKKQNRLTIEVNGNRYEFTVEPDAVVKRKAMNSSDRDNDKTFLLKSPMPGKICEVFVTKGTLVKKGEPLLILEAMKMQNQVLAVCDAKVKAVHIKSGDAVFGDQILMELEKE